MNSLDAARRILEREYIINPESIDVVEKYKSLEHRLQIEIPIWNVNGPRTITKSNGWPAAISKSSSGEKARSRTRLRGISPLSVTTRSLSLSLGYNKKVRAWASCW